MNLPERKKDVYERASTDLKSSIVKLRTMMEQCVEVYEEIRTRAHKEGFTVDDTKLLIATICDKMNLNAYYKKSFIKMVYPPVHDVSKMLANKDFYNPRGSHKDVIETEDIIRITKDQIPERVIKHMMRVYQDWFEIKLVEGVPTNIRCDTEPEWALQERWQIAAEGTIKELAALQST